jgi:ATP-dependent Clp protease ATP-binding subunit ClpC
MTSNLGSSNDSSSRALGFSDASGSKSKKRINEQRISDAIKNAFRPEFLNRIDEVIIFDPLDRDDVVKIVDIMLSELEDRLKPMNIQLSFDPSVKERIAEAGFDEKLGARPIRRAIRKLIEDPLANELLSGRLASKKLIRARLSDDVVEFF